MSVIGPVNAQADLTVEEAYQAIPHDRTPFDLKQSHIAAEDAKYLDHLFFVTDMAMRLRVQTLRQFLNLNPHNVASYNREIDNLIGSFDLVQTPPHLMNVQVTVLDSIKDQKEFFNDWARAGGTGQYQIISRSYAQHPRVQSSHQKLYAAYNELKALYPGETPHNTQAFFDHLCALDFI